MKMDNKEFRKKIRQCKTDAEIHSLVYSRKTVWVKRRSHWEIVESLSIYRLKGSERVHCQLPPNWSCSFKNLTIFSYNLRTSPEPETGCMWCKLFDKDKKECTAIRDGKLCRRFRENETTQ
jgi:hypothetical protein